MSGPITLGDFAMNHQLLASTALSAAMGLAFAMQGVSASAQDMKGMSKMPPVVQENMAKMAKNHLEKCYGINAVAKIDCAEGAHSCAGQATQAHDTKSFVLLPAGVCGKIAAGNLKPA
jgi:uncharacterized membrane protein